MNDTEKGSSHSREEPLKHVLFCWYFDLWFELGLNWFKFMSQTVLNPFPHNKPSLHRLHSREQQHITDTRTIRHQHHHSVNTIADTTGGRHADFQRICWAFGPAGGVEGVGKGKCWKTIPFNAKWCSFGVGLV